MTVKMKHSDLERAVKEYIEKLFPNIMVKDIAYSRKQKGDSVVVEAEVEHKEFTASEGEK